MNAVRASHPDWHGAVHGQRELVDRELQRCAQPVSDGVCLFLTVSILCINGSQICMHAFPSLGTEAGQAMAKCALIFPMYCCKSFGHYENENSEHSTARSRRGHAQKACCDHTVDLLIETDTSKRAYMYIA